MRAGRLVSLLLILQRRGRVTAAQLAGELEVSERTVLRDIDELSGAGVPVFAVRGPGGGFELLETGVDRLLAPTAHTTVDRHSTARRARVRITEEGRRIAAVLRFLQPLRLTRATPPDELGRLHASFRIRMMDTAIVEVLALGPHVEVLEPTDLREEIARRTEAAARLYRDLS